MAFSHKLTPLDAVGSQLTGNVGNTDDARRPVDNGSQLTWTASKKPPAGRHRIVIIHLFDLRCLSGLCRKGVSSRSFILSTSVYRPFLF